MIFATSPGWLISVDKLSETDHTVTIQDRGERTAPYTVPGTGFERDKQVDEYAAKVYRECYYGR